MGRRHAELLLQSPFTARRALGLLVAPDELFERGSARLAYVFVNGHSSLLGFNGGNGSGGQPFKRALRLGRIRRALAETVDSIPCLPPAAQRGVCRGGRDRRRRTARAAHGNGHHGHGVLDTRRNCQ